MLRIPSIYLLGILFVSMPAFAMFKCEAQGKITYSDIPCQSGKPAYINDRIGAVPVQDTQTALKKAAQEKRELEKLEKVQRRQEAKEERERKKERRIEENKAAMKKKHCAKLERQARWSAEDAASATAKGAQKAKRTARRLEETYQSECSAPF